MMLTSAGLMPDSAQMQKEAYAVLCREVSSKQPHRRGVLYMLDAKLLTLQFRLFNDDPEMEVEPGEAVVLGRRAA